MCWKRSASGVWHLPGGQPVVRQCWCKKQREAARLKESALACLVKQSTFAVQERLGASVARATDRYHSCWCAGSSMGRRYRTRRESRPAATVACTHAAAANKGPVARAHAATAGGRPSQMRAAGIAASTERRPRGRSSWTERSGDETAVSAARTFEIAMTIDYPRMHRDAQRWRGRSGALGRSARGQRNAQRGVANRVEALEGEGGG